MKQLQEKTSKEVFVTLNKLVPRLSLRNPAKELNVLFRLLYRGKSQHRREAGFQKLSKVSKDVRRCVNQDLFSCVRHLSQRHDESVSEVSAQVLQVATKAVENALFVDNLLSFMEKTYIDILQQLKMNLFVPTNLIMCASLSRLWFYMRLYLSAVCETHHRLQLLGELCHIQAFPQITRSKKSRYLPNAMVVVSATSSNTAQTRCSSSVTSGRHPVVDSGPNHQCVDLNSLLSLRARDFAQPMSSWGKEQGRISTDITVHQERADDAGSVQIGATTPAQKKQDQNNSTVSHEQQQQQQQEHGYLLQQSVQHLKRRQFYCRKPNSICVHCKDSRGRSVRVCVRNRKLLSVLRSRGKRKLVRADVLLLRSRQTPWRSGWLAVHLPHLTKSSLSNRHHPASRNEPQSLQSSAQTDDSDIRSMQRIFQQDIAEAARVDTDNDDMNDIDAIFSVLQN